MIKIKLELSLNKREKRTLLRTLNYFIETWGHGAGAWEQVHEEIALLKKIKALKQND